MTSARWRSHETPRLADRETPTPASSIGMSSATRSSRSAPAFCARVIRPRNASSVRRRASVTSGRSSACGRHWWKAAALHAKDRAFHQCLPQALDLPEVSEARSRTLDAFQRLIKRAQVAGALRSDVVAEDIPMLLAGVGLSRSSGPGVSWERHLALVIDGLRAEGAHPLPSKPLSRAQLDAMVSELPCPR